MSIDVPVYDCETRLLRPLGRLAVGGQCAYENGPSVLLTVYDGDRDLVEVQLRGPELAELRQQLAAAEENLAQMLGGER